MEKIHRKLRWIIQQKCNRDTSSVFIILLTVNRLFINQFFRESKEEMLKFCF